MSFKKARTAGSKKRQTNHDTKIMRSMTQANVSHLCTPIASKIFMIIDPATSNEIQGICHKSNDSQERSSCVVYRKIFCEKITIHPTEASQNKEGVKGK